MLKTLQCISRMLIFLFVIGINWIVLIVDKVCEITFKLHRIQMMNTKLHSLNIELKYFDVFPEFVLASADLDTWKHFTRCPTSGFLLTSEERNFWMSSFLQSVSW